MKIPKTIFLVLFIGMNGLFAQHQNVIIGEPLGYAYPAEASVIINPANTDEIMVVAMGNWYYTSIDGGYTWTDGTLQSTWGVQADPVALVDNNGQFYYLHLPDVIERVVCHRRDNISAPWSVESTVAYNGTHETDKEWATYDPVEDRIYLSWTYFDTWGSSNPLDSSCIYLSWTGDGGESWNEPVRISDQKGNAQGGNYSMHGSYPATGSNGEVYICWWGPDGLMFDRSLDQGITWLNEDINVTNQHVNWIYNIPGVQLGVSFPIIACDRSGGSNNGNIYICWADQRNGYNDTDVFMVKSEDGGLSWSIPTRINDDPPDRHQFFPFLTVDQVNGKVWLVFFDRRNHSDTNTDVYMAVSEDGGENFTNFEVSETPFVPYSTVWFGHYIGLAAEDDLVIPVWNRMDEGVSTVMGAIVNTGLIGIEESSKKPIATIQSSPNPFTESLFISFKLQQSAEVSLQLYDMAGRKIKDIISSKKYSKGKHVEKVNAIELGLKNDIYFIRLSTEYGQVTRQVVCVDNH